MPDESIAEKMELSDKMSKTLKELRTVAGIGEKLAAKLVSDGCMSVEQLREPRFYNTLSGKAKTALEWSNELAAEATQEEAETVTDFIRDNISGKFEVFLVGSHRRNQLSGTINILVFHPGHVHIPTPSDNVAKVLTKCKRGNQHVGRIAMAPNVLQPLRDRGLIAGDSTQGVRIWKGIVRVPQRDKCGAWEGRWIRVDAIKAREGVYRTVEIVMAPWKSKGAALLANTGDRNFCTDMSLSAKRLGMRLDDFGLWRRSEANVDYDASSASDSSPDAKPKGPWVLVAGETEESIFEELNRPFVEPSKRNFGFLKPNGSKPRLRDVVNSRKGRPKTVDDADLPEKKPRGRPRKEGLQEPSS